MRRSIKELRLARGWKQIDLAREIGIPREHLAKIENKTRGATESVPPRTRVRASS